VREIEEGLKLASKGGQFRLVQKWAVRSRDFYRAILEHQPQIVHFCGHGTGVDGIVLEDDTGQPTPVDQEALSRLFKLFAVKGVECVVLNACYSEAQAEAISQYIKNVIGMNQTIGDSSAIAFAVAFYDALGAGETVEFAFNLGCSQLVGLKEDQTPVLKTTSIHPADIQFERGDIPPNPYLGLSAFGDKDAEFFFGREKFTDELFEMTHHQPLVAVIGASGSGKSSVVFAGLIPRLKEEGIWLIESLRPKSEPFDELALALVRQLEPNLNKVERAIQVGRLAESLKKGEVKLHQVASQILEDKPNQRFLLVVDQFEELYTQCQDKGEQQRFIDTLLSAVQQKSITLVFTLRADFYGYVLSYLPFCEALQQFKHTPLGLMRREELQAAIEQPAQKLNVQLQTHLSERILDDVGTEPGNLPLLEFALTQLWDNQKDGELTHKAYDEIGGVKQALVKHAEQVYSRLSQSQQQQAQRVFLALVRLGEGIEDTRRVATQEEIGRENWELVTYLAGFEARLVVTGRNDKTSEETVEVVHEALIREWKRLREWLDSNREKLIQHRKIEAGAIEWRDKGKLNDYLLGGKQLNEAKTFQKEQASFFTLSGLASEFIQKSIKYRRNNRLRIIGLIMNPFLLIGAITFIATEQQRRDAQVYQAWQVIIAAHDQPGSGGRIQALEFLNSTPRRIPWFWLRWERESLSGLEAPKAYLVPSRKDDKNKGIRLSMANLSYANLQGAKLARANLQGATLYGANLQEADLWQANLQEADLQYANLHLAHLNANLHLAHLRHANLQGVDLKDANLQGAILEDANVQGADLSDAKLQNAKLQNAQYTDNSTSQQTCKLFTEDYPCPTTFPKDFDPKAAGMELVK